jgi:hypothetical protein
MSRTRIGPANPSLHRGRHLKRLVNPPEVVPHKVQRDGRAPDHLSLAGGISAVDADHCT